MAKAKRRTTALSGMALIRNTRGLQSELARQLGVTRQAIHDWDVVPVERLDQVEEITGFRREKLRPDIFNFRRRKTKKRRR